MGVRRMDDATGVERSILREQPRLVRLCAHLTGNADAAEDLAQETLYEALRNAHKLHDPSGSDRWLAAIARNVCLRWARKRARDSAHLVRLLSDDATLHACNRTVDDFDLESGLERRELVELLDKALALLPPTARDALLGEYVEGVPRDEMTAWLGLTEGAVEKRLQRGRVALRRILTNDLREEATVYGLCQPETDGWRETRIWCFLCGRHRLLGRFTDNHTELTFRCPGCSSLPSDNILHYRSNGLFADVKAFKPALKRILVAADEHFGPALVRRGAPCHACGSFTPLQPGLGYPAGECFAGEPTAHLSCLACGSGTNIGLLHLDLTLLQSQRFWREHPRLRRLPAVEVESEGRPALVTRLESVADRARLEIVHERDTWRVLSIHGPTGG